MAVHLDTIELADWQEVIEEFHARRWTDGLPIVPPEPRLVEEMLAAVSRAPDEQLGSLAGGLTLEVWQAAVCAVMAGCRPEYFPVVLATWDAAFEARFNLHAALTSSGGTAIAAVVSGPYATTIGMNSEHCLLGPGNRANASIGRAVRLAAISVLDAVPGALDASSFSHGGRYSMHFAERTPPAGWATVREQLGYPAESTTVSILAVEAPRQIAQRRNRTPEGLLSTIAACMRDPSQNGTGRGTYYIIALGPEHAGLLAGAGLTPADVRNELHERSRVTEAGLFAAGTLLDDSYQAIDGYLTVARPEHILVVTAGGSGGGWSAAIPCWTRSTTTHPVTSAVVTDGAPTARIAEPQLDF